MTAGRGGTRRYGGWTLLELSAVAVILSVVFLLLIQAIAPAPRIHSHKMTNSTQLRGIHQGLVTHAQSNKGYFVGLDSKGNLVNGTVEYRFQKLLESNFFWPEYTISPSETANVVPWVEPANSDADVAVTITPANYSYAMLDMDKPGGRQAEWYETLNTQAIVLGDRNTSTSANKPTSIHYGTGPWKGSVVWNDNIVGFEQSHIQSTAYANPLPGGSPYLFPQDNLFHAAGHDDAWLIYSGD